MIDHALLVDTPPYSLVISATNYKFTQHYDKPFSLFHTVKRSNVNKRVLCGFIMTLKRMAFAEILPGKSSCPPAEDYSDAMFNLSDQFLPDGK